MRRCAPAALARWRVRRLYDQRARESGTAIAFINYGYAPLEPGDVLPPAPPFLPQDEAHRLSANLYAHVTAPADLRDKDVVEVSSGRGGGCYLLKAGREAQRVVGIDLSRENVAISRRRFGAPGLEFRVGRAERLPLRPNSADAVVNVEAAHLYPDIPAFLREVHRVLRPGGWFLFADVINDRFSDGSLPGLLEASPLRVASSRDISANIVASLETRAPAVRRLFDGFACDERQRREWDEWACLPGTEGFRKFRDGIHRYMSFTLRKP